MSRAKQKDHVITTPGGERLVLLPEADYDRLVEQAEMAGDVALAEAVRSRIAAGTEDVLPAAIARRLIDGENLVKLWREHRGLSQAQLAEATDLNTTYISQIETGHRVGTVETLRRIADALKVKLDDIVD